LTFWRARPLEGAMSSKDPFTLAGSANLREPCASHQRFAIL
jgi:hypothetical protein